MKLIRWQQACEAMLIFATPDYVESPVPAEDCNETTWTAIKRSHNATMHEEEAIRDAKLKIFTFPELYEVDDGDLDPASPFLDSANEDAECMAISGIYEKRRKLFEKYGETRSIPAVYVHDMAKGWTQDMGFADSKFKLNGQVDCGETCTAINGWLHGVRFMMKGVGKECNSQVVYEEEGPAFTVDHRAEDQKMLDCPMFGFDTVEKAEQRAREFLQECFGGKCIDDQDDFAVECECQSWKRWVVAVCNLWFGESD